MATMKDVHVCLRGPGGSVVWSMPDQVKAPFAKKTDALGRQIAADHDQDFETCELPPEDTVLSAKAEKLLRELETLKRDILLQKR